MQIKKYIPNILTTFRILGTTLLLFFTTLSLPFIIIYLLCGLSDMLDGLFARKFKVESEFGEMFDSIADLFFIIVCLNKILLVLRIDTWIFIWILVIALIKIMNIISGYVVQHKVTFLHTKANKLTGLLLFLAPILLLWIPLNYISFVLCIIATFAAIQEGHLIRTKQPIGGEQ